MTVRTRFEPSPSGSIHVGTAMMCSFNWFIARKAGGQFVLRVADTDASRVVPEGLESVVTDLRWLGLTWDEGPETGGPNAPYFQSERTQLYREAAERLLGSGNAYRCYCTADELEAMRERARAEKRPPRYEGRCRDLTDAERAALDAQGRAAVVRFRVEPGVTTMTDLVRGEVTFEHDQVEDFVILRADGSALYNLAVSYDDLVMGMTHIIRGEDIFASTPKQIMIMRALGAANIPAYGHVPLIVGEDRRPLGKRHGDTAVAQFREKGYLPEVLLNYLATLNWSVGDGVTERFTVPELIERFDIAGVTRNPSAFDLAKLTAMNGDAIREMDPDDLTARLEPFVFDGREPTDAERAILRQIVPHIQERMKRLDEAGSQLAFLFGEVEPDEKARTALAAGAGHIAAARSVLDGITDWRTEPIQQALMAWADDAGIKRKEAFQPLRAAITGSLVSPPLFESMEILGREICLTRIARAAG